ncbi:hypothetical protein TPHA_0F02280 [Tetrapisispora phaffii CBS 4417]|uniref:Phosphatidylserine decarboxylase proenzyme 1, mitochondrial n=1 Tax=Tetrapisispora phaffii (strain ATCC 24235 / CBS 4417 / NBRC 1672 / NRRL Y-8282 / UCD 70-5) TaxID=1071381 RepID=G8BUC3_TETPH|nr:hypothetical protein TPHA_0F02280 [Tetrapisispora phaffii CBS 4417]CCE63709.1 hypothetical protein TPHA_0F02280 [Tetrapisispora phaffii CBS 4417]
MLGTKKLVLKAIIHNGRQPLHNGTTLNNGLRLFNDVHQAPLLLRRLLSSTRQNFNKPNSETNGSGNKNQPKKRKISKIKILFISGFALGITATIIENRRHKDNETVIKSKDINITSNSWFLFIYSTLPLNAISRIWGHFNNLTLPEWSRTYGFKLYSYLFGVNLEEMADPNLSHYSNLAEFFYRDIKKESRPIALNPNAVASPSDGKILKLGIINKETGDVDQIKGMSYSVKELLGTHSSSNTRVVKYTSDKIYENDTQDIPLVDTSDMKYQIKGNLAVEKKKSSITESINFLHELSSNYITRGTHKSNVDDSQIYYAVIYLAPGDYHHFHSPVNWVCQLRRHFPGALFSVSPFFQRNFHNLFVLNERVALLGYWKYGFFSMTPVGATNVGSITINFDKELVTNSKINKKSKEPICYESNYSNASKILAGIPLVKGEDMGGFKLGSTVVICFEAPRTFSYNVQEGDTVKMGQSLGSIN